jgi:Uma2 family endonuclease
MAIATNRRMTLEEYLNYDDGTDTRYELVDGVLVEMGTESALNVLIALFLLVTFSSFVPLNRLRRGTEVETPQGMATSRYPDLLVLTEAGAMTLAGASRSLVRADMPVPALVVEVVSPGKPGEKNYDRDYIEKRQEYAEQDIPEYWLIDPQRQVVLVLTLEGQSYQEKCFIALQSSEYTISKARILGWRAISLLRNVITFVRSAISGKQRSPLPHFPI